MLSTQTSKIDGAIPSSMPDSFELRRKLFSCGNFAAPLFLFYFISRHASLTVAMFVWVSYLAIALSSYFLIVNYAKASNKLFLLPILCPILMMGLVKYAHRILPLLGAPPAYCAVLNGSAISLFIGISYVSFRMVQLTLEVRNGSVELPSVFEFLGFVFFIPTLWVGPISRYKSFRQSAHGGQISTTSLILSIQRIVIGGAKYFFLGTLFHQISYETLVSVGASVPTAYAWALLFSYYAYLYCNFSGLCDLAIGVSGLIGIQIDENFNNPLAAPNLQDFWNRWHITLARFVRELVFTPLSKFFAQWMPVKHAVAIAIAAVFLIIGAWHSLRLHYFVFGALHALGVIARHYYVLALQRRLSKEKFRRYLQNRWVRLVAIVLTQFYVALTLQFFSLEVPQAWSVIRALF